MSIMKLVDIDSITPYANNPRKNDGKPVDVVARSIKLYGFQSPLVVDRDNVIVVGHTRWKAAKKLGMKTVPVVEAKKNGDWLSEAECRAYRIADNRTALASKWDDDLLKIELDTLKIEMPDIALDDLTGFTMGEIGKLIDTSVEGEDDVPEPRETSVHLGDIYRLGEHKIMCADCRDENALQLLMEGAKADMAFTDPPYGVSQGEKNKALNEMAGGDRKEDDIKDDDLSPDALYEQLVVAFKNLKSIVLADCSTVFTCSPQGGGLGMMMMMMMMKEAGLEAKHVLIWKKNCPTFSMGRLDYDYQHEPILLSWNKSHKFYGEGRFRTSVWDFDKPRASKEHPTMKPIELVENALLNNSKRDDIVADIYLGSGTTLIACEKTGRKCYGTEISPTYCQVIIDRWEKFTGKKAVKIA